MTSNLPFVDLQAQYQRLQPEIEKRFRQVMAHGHFIMGPEIDELEIALKGITGARHAITCASGTDALLMPLMAWGVGPGDAVFVPAFTFYATAEVVLQLGATPVFVDVRPDTFNMDPAALEKAVEAVLRQDATLYPLPATALHSPLTPRGVIPVDLFGQAADYEALLPIARRYGLWLFEDAAQSFGGKRHGTPLCGIGCEAAATSFFPAKPLGCYGDGGAIFTDDDALAEALRSIRMHGKGQHKYENVRVGLNGRMDTLQAALMLPKLDIFAEELEARQRLAEAYSQRLGKIPGIVTPHVEADNRSAWAQYTILLDDAQARDTLAVRLQKQGIPTAIYYPRPLHVQNVVAFLRYKGEDMPVSTNLCQRVLSLPMHPYMSPVDFERVCTGVEEACGM